MKNTSYDIMNSISSGRSFFSRGVAWKKFSLLVAVFCICNTISAAKKVDSTDLKIFRQHENKLQHYFDSLKSLKKEKARLRLNQEILAEFEKALNHQTSFHYSFDSLQSIGNLKSEDGRIKIYTWNIPLNHGMHKYFGYIQRYDKKADTTYLYVLQDQEESGKPHEYKEFTPNNWYGALYYEIVEQKINGQKIYTLLGYDLNDMLSSYKLIDILSFKNNQPIFGAPLFAHKNKNPYRVIFEYSSRVAMTLTHDKRKKMIIFDQLVPFQPSMKGNHQFYGPSSAYDGFSFEQNQWIHHSDVDARNR